MIIRGADDETGYVQETTVSMWGGDVASGAFITFLPISLVISQGWGLIDLPLRASNEGLLRPRVARAQKIIRLHRFPSHYRHRFRPGHAGIQVGVVGQDNPAAGRWG